MGGRQVTDPAMTSGGCGVDHFERVGDRSVAVNKTMKIKSSPDWVRLTYRLSLTPSLRNLYIITKCILIGIVKYI